MSADALDPDEYMDRAEKGVLAGVSEGLAVHAGSLLGYERWTDENGHWLRVRVALASRPGVEVHYARVLLPASGPDLSADGEAAVFSSGFEERLHTRVHRIEAVDGVVVL